MRDLKIKEFREEFGLSQEDLAAELGVTRNTIINWESGKMPPVSTQKRVEAFIIQKIENKGNVIEVEEKVNKLTNYQPSNDQLIPAYSVDFIAGNSFEAVESSVTQPDHYMDIPEFRGCTAFKAYSDSMEGLIKSGSWLFGTKVERWNEHLEFGQIYGIVCNDGRKYLKYIKKFREDPKTYFLLESENKNYDEFEMPKTGIRSIWLIHGYLTTRV